MQTASGTLTAAIGGSDRQPKAQLLIDWDNDGTFAQAIDDQSARVETIQIDRTLTTDLPDAVDLLAGYSTATATVTLSGDTTDETKTATWYYSPYSTGSPIYGKRRRWRTVLLALGFAGTAGTELLPAMTGKTRDLSTNGAGKIATLDVYDNTELMRGSIDVPLVIADDHASKRIGLKSSWLVDSIARGCGFYAAPPTRPGALFAASFAGSLQPFVGSVATTGINLPQFAAGKFIESLQANDPILAFATSGSASTNNGGEVLIEGWINTPGYTGSGVNGFQLASLDSGTFVANRITLSTNSSGHLVTAIARTNGGASTTYDSGISVAAGQWVYVAVHVYMTSSNITLHWRVNGTSATSTVSTTSVTGQPALTRFAPAQNSDSTGAFNQINMEAWQVSVPGTTTSAPSWNDAFIPNAIIQPSLNALGASVSTTDAAANVIQQIAAAEMATAGFDETGRFTFYTRSRWTSAPYTTSQRTIDASSLKDLTVTEATDQVRNRVRATASPAAVQNAGFVWRSADVITVPTSGSTTVTATFDNPATNVDTSIGYSTVNGPLSSYFRTNRNRDGSGAAVATGVTVTVTALTGTTATLTIANSNAFPVYLVAPAGFSDPQGTPALAIWGQAVLYAQSPTPDTTTVGVTVPTQTVYDVSDATSIAQHGEQLLEIPVNPWLQDGASLAALVADLLARLKDPPPVLTGLSIPYDPRLQLGDRVTVIADPFGLSADFFLIGSHVNVTIGGGASQLLDTRAV